MKVLSALYLIWVLFTTTLGAYLGSEAFYHLATAAGPVRHPWLASVLHLGLFVVVFTQGLLLHLRVPSNAVLLLGFLVIEGTILAALHFLA